MLRKLLLLLSPFAIVLALEVAFETGIWEPLAQPASHAGTSVRLKRKLTDPALAHIDFVTLGSSRPEYGIDHAAVAAAARRSGRVHADLTLPGSHWMTVGILTRWLRREHPEIRGGIIALSIQDFRYPGNGDYELGIVYPFRTLGDIPWMARHVPFRRGDVGSYATWSALFGWRADIADFVRHPLDRLRSIRWYALNRSSVDSLFGNPESQGDMCAFGVDSLAACDKVDATQGASADGLRRQCRELRSEAASRPDYDALARARPLPAFMDDVRTLVRAQLRDAGWARPPVVVLMPMAPLWQHDALGPGLHDWALSVLQPLVRNADIELIDATNFFDRDEDGGCGAFFDFYHQNGAGRERLSHWLLPQLQSMLYRQQGAGHERAADTNAGTPP